VRIVASAHVSFVGTHVGSAKSRRPSQLSSRRLSQISIAPGSTSAA